MASLKAPAEVVWRDVKEADVHDTIFAVDQYGRSRGCWVDSQVRPIQRGDKLDLVFRIAGPCKTIAWMQAHGYHCNAAIWGSSALSVQPLQHSDCKVMETSYL